jgi:hypothetical protein
MLKLLFTPVTILLYLFNTTTVNIQCSSTAVLRQTKRLLTERVACGHMTGSSLVIKSLQVSYSILWNGSAHLCTRQYVQFLRYLTENA